MPLILCHSPIGGAGTTFIAAQIAMLLAQNGHDVAAVDFSYQDTLKLFFGLPPSQALPEMADGSTEPTIVVGTQLLSGYKLSRDARLGNMLAKPGQTPFAGARLFIADVAAGDIETRELLLPHALLHICPLLPGPTCLAALPNMQHWTTTATLPNSVFVLNQLDDTRRLSRDTHVFLRQLFGPMLAGTIRRDEAVNEAAAMLEPLARYAPTSVAFSDLGKLARTIEENYLLAAQGADNQ